MADLPNYETLDIRRDGAADWLTLNRPDRLNAFNHRMIEELHDYLDRLMGDQSVRVLAISGAGRAFCAGVDVKSMKELVTNGLVPDMQNQRWISDVVVKLRRMPQPVIACLNGAATGGGFALALAADVRIAAASARMNCAFIKIGLTSCDMGLSWFLPRLVGVTVASELMLTGRFIDAPRAAAVKLVSEVVADDALEATAAGYVADMLATAPLGLRLTKDGINAALSAPSLEAAIAVEDRNQVMTLQTEDCREGLAAFFEKRPAEFRGA